MPTTPASTPFNVFRIFEEDDFSGTLADLVSSYFDIDVPDPSIASGYKSHRLRGEVLRQLLASQQYQAIPLTAAQALAADGEGIQPIAYRILRGSGGNPAARRGDVVVQGLVASPGTVAGEGDIPAQFAPVGLWLDPATGQWEQARYDAATDTVSPVGGGTVYTAGNGIDITNGVISLAGTTPVLTPVATSLLSGQSLALGTGVLGDLSVYPLSTISPDMRRQFQRSFIWSAKNNQLEQLFPPANNLAAGDATQVVGQTRPPSFGNELVYAQLFEQEKTGQLYQLKVTGDGLSIDNWGDPNSGRLKAILDQWAAMTAAMAAVGKRPVLDSFVWIQGQSDQANPGGYAAKLTQLVARLRAAGIIQAQTKIVIVAVNPAGSIGGGPNGTAIYAEQTNYVASEAQAVLVEIDDLTTYDGTHLIASAHCILGERVFAAVYGGQASLFPPPSTNAMAPGTYQESDPRIAQSGTWVRTAGGNGTNDAQSDAAFIAPGNVGYKDWNIETTAGGHLYLDHATFSSLRLYYSVSIDGGPPTVVDILAPDSPFAQRYDSGPLAAGAHTVRLYADGTGYGWLDQIRIT